jgi:DNA-binding transcriptional LysR family regulator
LKYQNWYAVMPDTPSDVLHLKHLALIAAIADHGQLSLAAAALHITQPAASRTLAEAELRAGTPLFLRQPKGMAPTPAGDSLARRARNILVELVEARAEVSRLRLGEGGIVQIGAVTGAAVAYVAPALRTLRDMMPDVELHVEVTTSEALMAGLLGLRHDMILGRLPPRMPGEALIYQPARGEVIHILAHKSHAQAGRREVSISALSQDEWVIQGAGSPIRQTVDAAFLTEGLPPPHRVVNTASLLMVLALLDQPACVTPVSAEVADLLTRAADHLVRLDMACPMHLAPYGLISLRDRRLSPAAMRCRAVLSDLVTAPMTGVTN